jgi:hypothetical protein
MHCKLEKLEFIIIVYHKFIIPLKLACDRLDWIKKATAKIIETP